MKGIECLQRFKEFLVICSVLYLFGVLITFLYDYLNTGRVTNALLIMLGVHLAISLFAAQWLYRMDYLKNKSKLYILVFFSGVIGYWAAINETRKLIRRRQHGYTRDLSDD
jgi:hypothetical protein